MKQTYFILMVLCVISLSGFSQSYTISGEIRDTYKNLIPDANVMIPELNKGSVTNVNGKFELKNIPEGSYTMKVIYLGFETIEQQVEVLRHLKIIFFN